MSRILPHTKASKLGARPEGLGFVRSRNHTAVIVGYAVISFGGILGMGHSHHPVPWPGLKYDTKLEGFVTGITESQLKDAPEFSDDSNGDRTAESRDYQHYNAAPYWGL